MAGVDLFLGNSKLQTNEAEVAGQFINFENDEFYQIKNYDSMLPFFISLVSDSDHWMFISSTGGLTAGRKNPDNALFPYYTDDKINECFEITGSKTILHVSANGKKMLWEPFSGKYNGVYAIERNIYKNTTNINTNTNKPNKFYNINIFKFK